MGETESGSSAASRSPYLHLGSHDGRPFRVDANLIATGRTCVLGSSGSGKSYTVGVICEELCKNRVPFLIIDTEGEYSGLKAKYEVLWLGEDEGSDLSWSTVNIEELGKHAPDIPPVVVDVSETDDPKGKVSALLTALYREISNQRVPYLVILEEADRFVPQSGDRVPIFGEIARRGRKRGMGLMICSQRPSLVDKNVLSQCANQLIGKLVIQNDLQSVAQFFPGRGLPRQLTSLKAGVFYALGGISPVPASIKVRERETKHGGATPLLGQRKAHPIAEIARFREIVRAEPELKPQLGVAPLITAEEIPTLVKKEKSFLFFGRTEVVSAVHLHFRALVELGVRLRTGIIKKKFENFFLVLDGEKGKVVDLYDRLVLSDGFERLLGLNSLQVELLRVISPDRDTTLIEIVSMMGDSKGVLRGAMNLLEKKRLVRSTTIGRIKVFRRMLDFPKFSWMSQPLDLQDVNLKQGKIAEVKIKESEIREIIKGMWEGADLESFRPFLYPVYKVELLLKRRRREIWLDGRNGKNASL